MKYTLIGENEKSILQVFRNRKVSPSSIFKADENSVHDPFLLKNMEEAVKLVKKHIDAGSLIYIQQDPDADGMTSTALLVTYLRKVEPTSRIIVGIHRGKQHGIDLDMLEELEAEHGVVSLVIAPDASSNEHEIHGKLRAMGKDVVVLDHHDAYLYSPHAVMVNPQLDGYPNKNISGVGVSQKFARGYDLLFNGGDTAISDSMYDLVAIGMIADMIEINTAEAVYMVQQGMNNVNNSFLKALYQKQDYSMRGVITPIGISFYIAPLLNAVTRTATMEEKVLVLRAMVEETPMKVKSTKRGAKPGDKEILQEQAVRIMANIKSRQGRLVDRAIDLVEEKIKKDALDENQLIIVDLEGEVEKEFTGLIANKVMAEHQKPVLIGNVKNGVLMGSGRSYDKSSLPDLKTFLQESSIVEFAEGHAAAHGFGVKENKVKSLIDYSNTELKDLDFTPQHLVDFEWEARHVDKHFLEELTSLAPYWAKGLEEPYFVIKGLEVPKESVEIGGNFNSRMVKITLPDYTLIKFRVEEEKASSLLKGAMVKIDCIGRASINEYNGTRTIQVFMEDFEVVGQQRFRF